MSLYNVSVPAFLRTLEALSKILDKAAAHAEAKKIDPAVLTGARLYPDMLPFTKQIQIACDFAAKTTARLAAAEVPTFPDTETTFPELKQRIAAATEYVKRFKPEQMEGAETRTITLTIRGNNRDFTGETYLTHFAFPNFFFHAATAYDILRHNGIEIGKTDFLGAA
jgi:hypothetical protein